MLFAIADAAINFYSGISALFESTYHHIKTRTFENRLIYYALYDSVTKRYTLVYDHDKPLSVFWHCLFGPWLSTALVNYDDLGGILHSEGLAAVCSYVMHGEQRYALYDREAYRAGWTRNQQKVVFAYSNTNEDLTHEFERFKSTVFELYKRLGAQNVFNMLAGYKNKAAEPIEYITSMTDIDFTEKKLM